MFAMHSGDCLECLDEFAAQLTKTTEGPAIKGLRNLQLWVVLWLERWFEFAGRLAGYRAVKRRV